MICMNVDASRSKICKTNEMKNNFFFAVAMNYIPIFFGNLTKDKAKFSFARCDLKNRFPFMNSCSSHLMTFRAFSLCFLSSSNSENTASGMRMMNFLIFAKFFTTCVYSDRALVSTTMYGVKITFVVFSFFI